MSVSIAKRDAHVKSSGLNVDARGIRMQPAIGIPHQRNIAFENRVDPDFGKFSEDPGATRNLERLRNGRR
jgi:hypothetical protein